MAIDIPSSHSYKYSRNIMYADSSLVRALDPSSENLTLLNALRTKSYKQ